MGPTRASEDRPSYVWCVREAPRQGRAELALDEGEDPVALGVDAGLLGAHPLTEEGDERVLGGHGEEAAVAVGEEAGDGAAGLGEVKLALDGAELDVEGGELLAQDLRVVDVHGRGVRERDN